LDLRRKEGGWRRLHIEDLHNLYASPYIIRVNKSRTRWAGHVAHEMRNVYIIFVGKPKGKIPLRRPSCRWQNNVRMDLTEIRQEGVDMVKHTSCEADHSDDILASQISYV
jgi:hypothetical protein